ncbi:MAG TPA: acyl-CoA dehydrogenase family protein, partial [Acidimicrobiia bacterium]
MDVSEAELFERSVRRATERHSGDALDDALTELGWPDALAADPHTAVSVLFPLLGAAPAASSALDQVVSTGLGMRDIADPMVLPALGSWAAPAVVAGDRVSIRGLGTAAVRRGARAVVVAGRDGDGTTVAMVATSDLTLRPVRGIDPDFGLVEVTAEAVDTDLSLGAPSNPWGAAVVLAQVALSAEILGAARAMLALAREHALDRIQFDQPIAKFQAVRHRLAETLVAIETADGAVQAAREEPSRELAAVAKALAGRGALTASRHCQQVL